MLRYETQSRLKQFLIAVTDGETSIELHRQVLAEQHRFEPYAGFTRIDRTAKGYIGAVDLLSFVRDNGIHDITESECFNLIVFFDSKSAGRLDYNE